MEVLQWLSGIGPVVIIGGIVHVLGRLTALEVKMDNAIKGGGESQGLISDHGKRIVSLENFQEEVRRREAAAYSG